MSFDPSEYYSGNKVLLHITGEYGDRPYSIDAYCSPDANGRTFLLGGDVDLETNVTENYDAPFLVDIVIAGNQHPQAGEMEAIREELGTEFDNQFSEKIDQVYDIIASSDDPLQEITDVDAPNLIDDEE